jgi:hypothetical protein
MIIQNPLLTGSLNYNGADLSNVTSSNANSASVSLVLTAVSSSNQQLSASYIALSGSYNVFSGSASTRVTQIENTYATTGSNSFRADQSITGSLVVSSTITAQTLVVQTVTSSIVYSSGSNLFGNALANTQTFTGSVNITGSLAIAGNITSNGTAVMLGTGSANYLPKFTAASTIGNSQIFDNGTNVGINQPSPTRTLDILGASGIGTVLKLQGASGTTTYLQMAYNGATNAQSGYIGYNSSSQMQFFTNDTVALTIDSNRNLGLGVTPSAWSLGKALDISGGPSILGLSNSTQISNNAYYNSAWIYKATSFAQNFVLDNDGGFKFFQAPSGTAGNAITFTQAMTLFSTGNLAVGTTTDSGYKLDVNGTGRFTGNVLMGTSSLSNPVGFGNVLNIKASDAALVISNTGGTAKNWSIGALQSGSLSIFDGTTLRMDISSTGNVSITDTASFGGQARLFSRITADATTVGKITDSSFHIWNTTNVGSLSQITFGYTNGSTTNASVYLGLITTNGTGSGFGDFVLGTAPSANVQCVERFRIASTGAATFSSSVTTGGSAYIQPNASSNNVGLFIQNNSTGGYGSSLGLGLYGYNTSAYFNPLRIESSYAGYGIVNFYVKTQSTSTEIAALNILCETGAASFYSTVSTGDMVTIAISDISTGENKGLRLNNTGASGKAWNITAGQAGSNNADFVIRNSTSHVNNLILDGSSGAATFSSSIGATSAGISSTSISTTASTTLSSSRGIIVDASTTTNSAFVPIGFSWAASVSTYNPTWGMGLQTANYNAGTANLVFYTAGTTRMTILDGGSVSITGALSKGSGSFRIKHPLVSKKNTHQLVHSFIEGPQADLIYRGKIRLVAGRATVNIDEAATMTEGTFEALCREVQCFTSNETSWDSVRGKVEGNILTIECQNTNSTDEISWIVIGERQDEHMYETDWTDENGKVVVEPLIPTESEQ